MRPICLLKAAQYALPELVPKWPPPNKARVLSSRKPSCHSRLNISSGSPVQAGATKTAAAGRAPSAATWSRPERASHEAERTPECAGDPQAARSADCGPTRDPTERHGPTPANHRPSAACCCSRGSGHWPGPKNVALTSDAHSNSDAGARPAARHARVLRLTSRKSRGLVP